MAFSQELVDDVLHRNYCDDKVRRLENLLGHSDKAILRRYTFHTIQQLMDPDERKRVYINNSYRLVTCWDGLSTCSGFIYEYIKIHKIPLGTGRPKTHPINENPLFPDNIGAQYWCSMHDVCHDDCCIYSLYGNINGEVYERIFVEFEEQLDNIFADS